MTRLACLLVLVLAPPALASGRLAPVNDPTDTPAVRQRMAATSARNVRFLEQVHPALTAPGVGERVDELELQDATLLGGRVVDYGTRVLLIDDAGRHVFPRDEVKALRRGRATDQPGRPDFCVSHIERTPRLPAGQEPAEGAAVTFLGHIENAGGGTTGAFVWSWRVDGEEVASGTARGLEPGGSTTVPLTWTWRGAARRIALTVTPGRPVDEISRVNNTVDDPLHGLPLLITTSRAERERALTAPNELGTFSHADTIQQRVRAWNFALADSVYPSTPDGCRTRLRVDRIVDLEHAPDTVPGRAQLEALRTEGGARPLYADANGFGPFQIERPTGDRLTEAAAAALNARANPKSRLSLAVLDAGGAPLSARVTVALSTPDGLFAPPFAAGPGSVDLGDASRLTVESRLLVCVAHSGRREEHVLEGAALLAAAFRGVTALTLRTAWSPAGPLPPAAVRCAPPAAMRTRVTVDRSPTIGACRYVAWVVPARTTDAAPAPVWEHDVDVDQDRFEFEVALPRGPVCVRVTAYDAAGRASTPTECFVPNLEAATHAVVTRFGHLFVTNGGLMRREPNGTWAPFHHVRGPRLAGLALAPWGELVATAPEAEALRFYRPDGSLVRELTSPLFRGAEDIAISPNGIAFLACPAERRLVRVELGANRVDAFAAEHVSRADAVCLLDDDRLAVCDTAGNRVLVLDRADGTLVATLDGLASPRALVANPAGHLLVSCANGVQVRAGATLAPGRLITEATGGPVGHATGLALDLDGSLLLIEPWLPVRTVTPEHLLAAN